MMLHYKSSGQGLPLVLIHAFPLSSGMWESQIKYLETKLRVIVMDLPGFGRSACDAQTTIPQMAQEIARLIDMIQVKEPAVIAGLSMGGYVTLEYFRQFPERVKGLGLFSTKAGEDTKEAREKRLKASSQIRKDGLEEFLKSTLPGLVGKTTQESNRKIVREISQMASSNAAEAVAAGLDAMASRNDSTELLAQIKCPVLIIAGEEDALIPVSEAESMHAAIPRSQLHRISQAGHLVNLEQPEAFDKILEKFLLQKF